MKNVLHLELLGSHLSASGQLAEDLRLHMEVRYKACIKFYNFLRENRVAPLVVKLEVLRACVTNSLLYNCEAFGNGIPNGLEKTYNKLLRRTLNVRVNTPSLPMYIESGFLPIEALFLARQLNFYKRYRDSAISSNTPRSQLFDRLMQEPTSYLQHYINLGVKYTSVADIFKESAEEVKRKIRNCASKDQYKFKTYLEINPTLQKSPFIENLHPLSRDIIRFRLGSHVLPIETGRWSRTIRANRICSNCKVLGDERHALFACSVIDRVALELPNSMSEIWNSADIFTLVKRMKEAEMLE